LLKAPIAFSAPHTAQRSEESSTWYNPEKHTQG
jgi:hypothetical protein